MFYEFEDEKIDLGSNLALKVCADLVHVFGDRDQAWLDKQSQFFKDILVDAKIALRKEATSQCQNA